MLCLVPRLAERAAELAEAPLMRSAIVFAARDVTRKFPAYRGTDYLLSGGLVPLLAVEFTVVLGLCRLTLAQHLAERDTVASAVHVVLLLLLAIMRWLIGRRAAAI